MRRENKAALFVALPLVFRRRFARAEGCREARVDISAVSQAKAGSRPQTSWRFVAGPPWRRRKPCALSLTPTHNSETAGDLMHSVWPVGGIYCFVFHFSSDEFSRLARFVTQNGLNGSVSLAVYTFETMCDDSLDILGLVSVLSVGLSLCHSMSLSIYLSS